MGMNFDLFVGSMLSLVGYSLSCWEPRTIQQEENLSDSQVRWQLPRTISMT